MLEAGFHDVPPGHVAAVVTHLEMSAPPDGPARAAPEGVTLERVPEPETGWYRDLFGRVGGHPWLWFSRLAMDDASLRATLAGAEVHAVRRSGADVGIVEFDLRGDGTAELAFFGLVPEAVGQGIGGWALDAGLRLGWGRGIARMDVHTCTFDHPAALGLYIRAGFVPVRRQVEVVADPRLAGVLPMDAAGHVPVIG